MDHLSKLLGAKSMPAIERLYALVFLCRILALCAIYGSFITMLLSVKSMSAVERLYALVLYNIIRNGQ